MLMAMGKAIHGAVAAWPQFGKGSSVLVSDKLYQNTIVEMLTCTSIANARPNNTTIPFCQLNEII